MSDLTDPRAIKLKGILFLILGLLASALLLIEAPSLRIAVLLLIAIWSFCRFYYFAFYVIEHYVDPTFRFAGLGDFFCYLLRQRKKQLSVPVRFGIVVECVICVLPLPCGKEVLEARASAHSGAKLIRLDKLSEAVVVCGNRIKIMLAKLVQIIWPHRRPNDGNL